MSGDGTATNPYTAEWKRCIDSLNGGKCPPFLLYKILIGKKYKHSFFI
jgi:hypothetical protein